jgi:DNA-directed RNA polymerase specialized sigma24 family protein
MERDLPDEVADDRPATGPRRKLLRNELKTYILRALRQLTPQERVVFDIKPFQGMKLRTVGTILNISEGSVKRNLFRATRKLRLHLASYTQRAELIDDAEPSALKRYFKKDRVQLRCRRVSCPLR